MKKIQSSTYRNFKESGISILLGETDGKKIVDSIFLYNEGTELTHKYETTQQVLMDTESSKESCPMIFPST